LHRVEPGETSLCRQLRIEDHLARELAVVFLLPVVEEAEDLLGLLPFPQVCVGYRSGKRGRGGDWGARRGTGSWARGAGTMWCGCSCGRASPEGGSSRRKVQSFRSSVIFLEVGDRQNA
jgi:hypothetical protein